MTDLTKLAEVVRDACWAEFGPSLNAADITGQSKHDVDAKIADILAAHAQPEPVAEGEVQRYYPQLEDAWGGETQVASMGRHKTGEYVKFEDWQRTEAARAAAELDRKRHQDIAYAAVQDALALRDQLATELERSSALVALLDYWSYDGHLPTYESREEFRKAVRDVIQSSQENGS